LVGGRAFLGDKVEAGVGENDAIMMNMMIMIERAAGVWMETVSLVPMV
jgi:hypothetical protein